MADPVRRWYALLVTTNALGLVLAAARWSVAPVVVGIVLDAGVLSVATLLIRSTLGSSYAPGAGRRRLAGWSLGVVCTAVAVAGTASYSFLLAASELTLLILTSPHVRRASQAWPDHRPTRSPHQEDQNNLHL